jgi:hypothetical protein
MEVTRGLGKIHNDELHDLYSSRIHKSTSQYEFWERVFFIRFKNWVYENVRILLVSDVAVT